MKYTLPSIFFLPFMIGKPVRCIWQGKVFQTSVMLVSPLGIHDSTPRVQCVWAHPEGYHILLYHIENSHRSRLININLSSYLTTSPAPPPCTTEACGHLSQEKADFRQRLFPGAWLTMAPHLMEGSQWRLHWSSYALVPIATHTFLACYRSLGRYVHP